MVWRAFTRVPYSIYCHEDIDDKLGGGNRVQEACSPFVTSRYRINPVMVRIGGLIQGVERHQTFELGQFGRGW